MSRLRRRENAIQHVRITSTIIVDNDHTKDETKKTCHCHASLAMENTPNDRITVDRVHVCLFSHTNPHVSFQLFIKFNVTKKYKRTTFERMIRARTSRTIRNIDARNRNLQGKTIPTIAQIYWATSENTCNMQNVYDNPRDTVTEVYELKIGESKRENKTLKKIIELPNYYNEFRKKTE